MLSFLAGLILGPVILIILVMWVIGLIASLFGK